MKTSDPLTDLLNRLRNAMSAGHQRVDVPASRIKEDVLRVLAEEGYVGSWRRVEEKGRPVLRVGLKYDHEGGPIVAGMERVSRPGRRVYAPAKEIPEVLGGLGISIVSTSKGIVTGRQARESRLGGEILCNVW
jgi:small subunit ribosomal protein S8